MKGNKICFDDSTNTNIDTVIDKSIGNQNKVIYLIIQHHCFCLDH